jgi:NAD(P)-dependent dehydrogenase (short-subunit alcohol dehydrogenase family)
MSGGLGRLAGKRALVTGAGSGIGAATALLFAREGARVGLLERNEAGLAASAAAIEGAGGSVLALRTDVSDEAQVAAAVDAIVAAWGGLDVAVGVAGIEPYDRGDGRVHEVGMEIWQEILGTNLTGMFLTAKHAVRAMLASGGGSIVLTGSPTGLVGSGSFETGYSASKAGVHGLVRPIASGYAADGIRCNLVVPGFIDTPINAAFIAGAESIEQVCAEIGIPARRPGRADEVAAMNLWLASDESSYATGGYFVVDGGQTAI